MYLPKWRRKSISRMSLSKIVEGSDAPWREGLKLHLTTGHPRIRSATLSFSLRGSLTNSLLSNFALRCSTAFSAPSKNSDSLQVASWRCRNLVGRKTALRSKKLRCVLNTRWCRRILSMNGLIALFALYIAVIIATAAERRQVLCQLDFRAFQEFLINRFFIIELINSIRLTCNKVCAP